MFDVEAALHVIDAASPPFLTKPQRRRLAAALVLLADETRAEVLAAAEARKKAAFDAVGRSKIMAVDDWMSEARRRGLVEDIVVWSVLEQLAELPSWAERGRPSPASRPGRKPKGDVRLYGALLSLYEQVTGRPAGRDRDTVAFVQSFMNKAGKTFAAGERGSMQPPREKSPGKRWDPLSPDAFRKRFKQFEDAKDPVRACHLLERVREERKE